MLTVYIVTAVVGGIMILAAALMGHGDASVDAHADFHIGDHDLSHDHNFDGAEGVWMHLFSIRFWTYLCATFGTVGALLTLLTDSKEPAIGFISLATALIAAGAIVALFATLKARESNSKAALIDLIGSAGKVLVTVRKDQPGKVRCEIKGESLDLLALTEGEEVIAPGTEVVILNVENDRAIVASRTSIFDE